LQLEEDGQIVGDSGWCENTITNDGKLSFLVKTLAASAGSALPGYIGIGTGTAPNATHTTLDGELTDTADGRKALTANTIAGSTSVGFYATFATDGNHITDSHDIANIGLFAVSLATDAATVGTLFAGNTFTSSTWATNQALNVSYQINFS
jgi:hypothetical protein